MALKEELLAYVPEDKRAEFAEKTAGYDVLTDDIAFERVKKSQSLTDKIATPIVEARFKNFETEKLAGILEAEREKTRKEFEQKPETPEQKAMREMKEELRAFKAEKETEAKKSALRAKAAELGYDPLKAERFYALPEAESFIAEQAEEVKAYKAKIEELEKRIKYGTNPPPAGKTGANVISAAELAKLDPKAQAAFFAKGGVLTD